MTGAPTRTVDGGVGVAVAVSAAMFRIGAGSATKVTTSPSVLSVTRWLGQLGSEPSVTVVWSKPSVRTMRSSASHGAVGRPAMVPVKPSRVKPGQRLAISMESWSSPSENTWKS